ncbi:MAG: LysR substrate-binding domain-containing protein [Pseudomonadota bacterium]
MLPQIAAPEAGELDLAVVFATPPVTAGEVLGVEPTVWVTSRAHGLHLQRPLPIAAYFRSDWCSTYMLTSLERMGIDYRIAFECDTVGGFWSALRSGLAVVALSRSTVPPDCRELTAADGFPVVDSACVVLRTSLRGSSPAVDGLAELIREAFRPSGLVAGAAA